MKKKIVTVIAMVFSMNIYAQKGTFKQVLNKDVKGLLTEYISENNISFKVGDSLRLGSPSSNENFDIIMQNAGISFYPLPA